MMEQILEFSSGTRRLKGSVALQQGIHGAAQSSSFPLRLLPWAHRQLPLPKTEHKTVLKPTKPLP
jgi:hypothetical protein